MNSINNNGKSLSYDYDEDGNIIRISSNNGLVAEYKYDKLNQLIREDNYENGKIVTYSYDSNGNLTRKIEYNITDINLSNPIRTCNYSYYDTSWSDKLTSYSVSGIDSDVSKSIEYDAIGNPIKYGNWSLSWEAGRRLASMSNSTAGINLSFKYNDNGIRTSKTVNGVITKFYLDGGQIVRQTDGDTTLDFFYDENGNLFGLKKNLQEIYYYVRNGQNDIIGLVNEAGALVATYTYDTWGKLISIKDSNNNDRTNDISFIGYINPFRYRGYYYDSETGLYYVSSRYYDPETCRFINADTTDILGLPYHNANQYNLFAYCNNNPVNDRDDDGQLSFLSKIAIGVGAVLVGAAVVAATAATGGVAAAFVGAALAGVKAAAISGAIGAAVGAGTSAISHRVSTGSWEGAGKAAFDGAVNGFADGFMTGGIMAGGSQALSGGFKIAANAGVKTGPNGGIKSTGILSPNRLRSANEVAKIAQKGQSFYDYGGQLFRIGSTKLDIGSKTFLHLHTAFTGASHIPVGIIGSGLYGGLRQW